MAGRGIREVIEFVLCSNMSRFIGWYYFVPGNDPLLQPWQAAQENQQAVERR